VKKDFFALEDKKKTGHWKKNLLLFRPSIKKKFSGGMDYHSGKDWEKVPLLLQTPLSGGKNCSRKKRRQQRERNSSPVLGKRDRISRKKTPSVF